VVLWARNTQEHIYYEEKEGFMNASREIRFQTLSSQQSLNPFRLIRNWQLISLFFNKIQNLALHTGTSSGAIHALSITSNAHSNNISGVNQRLAPRNHPHAAVDSSLTWKREVAVSPNS
jgi:hypothetical protein